VTPRPRTDAGQTLLDILLDEGMAAFSVVERPEGGLVHPREQLSTVIERIEEEAHDQALGLLLMAGTDVPVSVLSFDNVKRATEAVEQRIRRQIEAES